MNIQKMDKWRKWLGDANKHGTIIHEMAELAMIRSIFSGLKEIVDNNPSLHQQSAFYHVFTVNYAHSVLMYIRRQVNYDRESKGLIMLAYDLKKNCSSITQDDYASLYTRVSVDEHDRRYRDIWGRSNFLKHFGGQTKTHLDPDIIQSDIEELLAIHKDSKSFTDRRIAHLDKQEPTSIPSLSQLDSWCDTLNEKLKKYIFLLEAADYHIEPVLQHDWKAIFRVPWLTDSVSS
ncbi:MAG: hypothetical protein SVY53_07585 [Chloroflexota bacterium]|nr:hypothetical protein [Chloroflexota bacterium]